MILCPCCGTVPHGDMSRRPKHLQKSGKKGSQHICECTRLRFRARTSTWTYVVHTGVHSSLLNFCEDGLRMSSGSWPAGHPNYRKFHHPLPSSGDEIQDFIRLAEVASVMIP